MEAFGLLVQDADRQPFSGWDFSYLEGRYEQSKVSWDFQGLLLRRLRRAGSLLVLGTGGGEFLSSLQPLPGATFAVTSILGCDGWAAAEWTWSGNKRGSDTHFSIKGASVIQIRDGKIARETIYYDPRSAL